MTIKLTPATISKNPKNILRIDVQYMHGDADAYTNEDINIQIPDEIANKEEVIAQILQALEKGFELMDEDNYVESPFVVADEDWNATNCDLETGIPLIGAKLHFVHKVKRTDYWTETLIDVGTVVEANDKTVVLEFEGTNYEVLNNDEFIAPEASIAVHVNGIEGEFTIDGIEVYFEGQGDCTRDGDGCARPSIDDVFYFDEHGNKFIVSGY